MITSKRQALRFIARRVEIEDASVGIMRDIVAEAFLTLLQRGMLRNFTEHLFRQAMQGNYPAIKELHRHLRRLLSELMRNAVLKTYDMVQEEDNNYFLWDAEEYLARNMQGETVDEKLDKYLSMTTREFMIWGALGNAEGMDDNTLYNTYLLYFAKPYHNPLMMQHSDIPLPISSPGKAGHYATADANLSRLLRGTITFAASDMLSDSWQQSGPQIKGYMVGRGSTFPCANCDAMQGFHPTAATLPPYHVNCRCWWYAIIE